MAKPRITVNTIAPEDNEIVPGTIMEHNDPPTMLVVVTEYFAGTEYFGGVCLDTGVYFADGWKDAEFHIFRGEVTLSQGI